MAMTCASSWIEFKYIKDTLELTDSTISKHLTTLSDSDFITIKKSTSGRYPKTFIRVTPAGAISFKEHVNELKAIIGQ